MEGRAAPQNLGESLGLVRLVEDGSNGKAVLEVQATMAMCHSGGVVQGGFVTGWIDAAMANVVITQTGRTLRPLSLEIKISFLKAAGPGRLFAEAWVERLGRTTAFMEGRLINEKGEVLAKGSSTAKLAPMVDGA